MKNIFVVLQHRLLETISKTCGSTMDYIDIILTFFVQKENYIIGKKAEHYGFNHHDEH